MGSLRKLRVNLTLINATVSGVILLAMALSALFLTEAHFLNEKENAFAYSVDMLTNQLQSETIIRHSYLTQVELSQNFMIYMEDGGTPIKWPGVLVSKTPRNILIDRAKRQAEENGILLDRQPLLNKNYTSIINGDFGDSYRMAVWVIPSDHGWYSLVVLMNRSEETASRRSYTLLFLGCAFIGVIALGAFSYVFAGRTIKPIEQSNEAQKRFVQAASHELRTPLAVIQTSADALQKAKEDDAMKFAAAIRQQSRHMARLVNDMLLLSSSDTKSLHMEIAPIETQQMLCEVADAFSLLAKEKGVEFSYTPAKMPILFGDEARLKQVFNILLDNALEYTPVNGIISLGSFHEGEEMKITVSDSGIGIPDEHKPFIFERFYRVDKSRSRVNMHYGLGLSIAKEIILLHNGSITVSDRKGGGTVFEIRLRLR